MGLLPEIAHDLLPALSARAPEEAYGRTGILISAYALGVVVGAPTIAAWVAKYPRRRVLVWLTAAFAIFTALSAIAPTFETAAVARLLAGIPHGAYFGIASLAAADLMGPGRRGRGVAAVLFGLTVSNVVGVPAVTSLGQSSGWRVAFLAVAGLFALAAAAIAVSLPRMPGSAGATIRSELSALGNGQVWLGMGIGAIGFGGFFAVYSYVSPLATGYTGLPTASVPWILATIGLGMTLGNLFGGRLADRDPLASLARILPLLGLALAGLALTARFPAALVAGLFLVGMLCCVMTPSVQVRLMDVAGSAQTLAAAINHSALNIGNSLGAALGGAVIAAGWGLVSPVWVAVALSAGGFLLVVLSRGLERRAQARG
ncbi:MFS transporter [Leucobacter sp. CSA1]|uniref:MFS transporter n=2 Tax=Leucobacter chromiisoli TaxID=2796471 RepID=A0A934Q885_9MICO|nr:MFS transporter [Leucobacter chromiisoli]